MSSPIIAIASVTPFEITVRGPLDQAAVTERLRDIRQRNLKSDKLFLNKLSTNALRKVRHSIHWLLFSHSNHCKSTMERRNFLRSNMAVITLTIPVEQFTNCKFIKNQMLAPFLRELSKDYQSPLYLWKAERQKNGNLHFHIIVARRVSMHWVRFKWWKYCALNGYFRPAEGSISWDMPPCTETKGLESITHVGSYLMKYVSKDCGGEPIDGRIWGCCHQLVGLSKLQIEVSLELFNKLQELVRQGHLVYNHYDYCGRFVGDIALIMKHVSNSLYEAILNHLDKFRHRMPDVRELRVMS